MVEDSKLLPAGSKLNTIAHQLVLHENGVEFHQKYICSIYSMLVPQPQLQQLCADLRSNVPGKIGRVDLCLGMPCLYAPIQWTGMGRLIQKTIKYEAANNKATLAQKIQILILLNHI